MASLLSGLRRCWEARGLRAGDRLLRALFYDAPLSYHELDRNGILRRVNRAECNLLGYSATELIGKPVWELCSPAEREPCRQAVLGKLAGTVALAPAEREYVRRDGAPISVRVHEKLIRNHDGTVVGLRAAVLDATDWQRAERALRESEARHRTLFENAPIGIYRSTPDGRILLANPAMARMLGYSSPEELASLDLKEPWFQPQYDRQAFKDLLEREGQVSGREAFWTTRDRRGVFLRESAWAVRDDSGAVCYEGVIEDITESKRAEQRLHETEERYRDLVENAYDVIFSVDLSGRFRGINRAGEQASGYSRQELLQMDIAALLPPADLLRARDAIQEKLAGSPPTPSTLTLQTRDGRLISIEVNSRLIFERGQPVGLEGIARDITERQRWQEELERKNVELSAALAAAREATEAKSRFLANMSHEIRTPMNGVLGMTDLLLRTALDPEQRDCCETIKQSSEALLAIINEILDLTKIEAGKLALDPLPFDVRKLVEEVHALLAVQAWGKQIALSCRIDERVPPAVLGDPVRLRQVLTNLAGNAVKFTELGQVRISLSVEDGALRFQVEDTGIGIAPEHAGRLFQSFTQADNSTTRKYGGTGLGLAISRQLVEMMGGKMGFSSEPGRGSIFWFTVPLVPAELPPAEPELGSQLQVLRAAIDAPNRHGGRVLLAEDNEVNRKIALRMLEQAGYEADAVENGRQAVEAALSGRYDLVLMDVHMPDMDGFQATAELRSHPAGAALPIIAMTARAMAGDREQCLQAGMNDYLPKPVRRQALEEALERWLTPTGRQWPSESPCR